jgi:Acidobacterial duplicated orphan permease
MASSSARSLSKIPSASSSRKNRPTTTAIPSAPTSTSSPPTSGDLAPQVRTFSDLAAYTLDSATITGRGHATLASVAIVTPNFFSVLGTRATFGRTFTAADPQPNTNRLAVVSHSYWQTELGGAASVIGQTVTANRIPFTIVGVMPPDFAFPREADFWVTSATDVPEHALGQSFDFAGRGNYLRTIVGRLAPHATARDAEAELTSILSQLPNPNNIQRNVHLVNLRDHTLGDTRPALAILLACVGLVLLIACLNVANLMLARATARERELAIRAALGASRWRIARQLLTESLALSLAGGLVGVLLSLWALELLVKIAPADIPRLAVIGLDGSVLAFALVISVLTGVLSGLAPILGTTRPDLAASIRSADKSGAAGTASRRLRSTLVAGEVAISLILLVAAGLLVRSLAQMEAFSWGFRPQNIVSARVAFLEERYATDTARVNFYRTLRDQLLAAPGIEAFGTSLDRIGTSWINLPFTAQGETYPNPGDRPPANYHIISPGYFDAVGLALQHGRNFSPDDDLDAPRVAIVDSNLARRHYPAGDAVGKTITVVTPEGDTPIEIVGIVGAVKFDGPAAAASRPDIYFPYLSFPQNNFYVHVRTPLAVGAAEALIKKAVREIDADIPVTDVASMEQVTAAPAAARRFPLGLLGGFALLALTLAAVGIYAVTKYSVTQRTREIGVRMALGAQPRSVISLVLQQGFRPIAIGLVVGLLGAALTAFAMRKLLFDVAPLDLPTFALVPLLLLATATLACLLPARRATRVDPLTALRTD